MDESIKRLKSLCKKKSHVKAKINIKTYDIDFMTEARAGLKKYKRAFYVSFKSKPSIKPENFQSPVPKANPHSKPTSFPSFFVSNPPPPESFLEDEGLLDNDE